MEGVDHIHVGEVRRGCLIGQIHRMLERQVPDGERLKLGVARFDPPTVLVVELAKAGGHLAAAGARGRHHHQGAAGLDILVAAIALLTDNHIDVVGVAGNGIVAVGPHTQSAQPLEESVCRRLAFVLRDHHAAHIQVHTPEDIDEPQHILLIGDTQIPTDLVLLDIAGADGHYDLHVVLELLEHTDLAVRLKAGQHPGCVVVVKELAAEFQVQLAAELLDPFPDMGRLRLQIFLVIKSDFSHTSSPHHSFQILSSILHLVFCHKGGSWKMDDEFSSSILDNSTRHLTAHRALPVWCAGISG